MNQQQSPKKGRAEKGRDQKGRGSGWKTRRAAARILTQIERGSGLNHALEKNTEYTTLQNTDKGWTRNMVSTALRARGRLDAALSGLTSRPLQQLDPPTRSLLRIGAAQIWLLQIPPHAAVSSSVDAARSMPEAKNSASMINAVLRRCSSETNLFDAQKDTDVWPEWLTHTFETALGQQRAQALARYQLTEPCLDLQTRSNPQPWVQKLQGQPIPGGVRLQFGSHIPAMPGYAQGQWWVQDAASAIVTRLLQPLDGLRILDMCAAPGGKTMQLAAAGAHVTALDINPERLQLLKDNLKRTRLNVTYIQADARKYQPESPFDAILLDAPCSALGNLRRHPEAVWQRQPEKSLSFPPLQQELLKAAASMLRPGGMLAYCVCTPVRDEGENLIKQTLESDLWQHLPVRPEEAGPFAHALTRSGDLLTAPPAQWPNVPANTLLGDVFYISRLKKISPV